MTKSREQRVRNGTLIPNSFQYPNMYIDWLSYYLTSEEEKVLNKAVREILGWEDKIATRRARIALSVFVEGKTSKKTGELTCLGCGLGLQTVRKALAALDQYRILVKEGDPTKDGQEYRIQDDADAIDWDGLAARREQWDKRNLKRTKAATQASMESRGITSDVGGNVARYPNPLGVTSHVTPGVASDVRGGVTSDVNKETQVETQKETEVSLSQDLWTRTLAQLQHQMPRATYDQWLADSEAVDRDDGLLRVQVRHRNGMA